MSKPSRTLRAGSPVAQGTSGLSAGLGRSSGHCRADSIDDLDATVIQVGRRLAFADGKVEVAGEPIGKANTMLIVA